MPPKSSFPACGRACRIPEAPPGTGRASTSRSFSANATKVELCLFDSTGEKEVERIELPEYRDEIWHGYVPELSARARSTATACTDRTSPRRATASIPNKLLLDPYARAHVGELNWDPAVFGYKIGDEQARPDLRRARQRAVHAEVRGRRPGLRLEAREGVAAGALGPHHHLRDARARLHQAASRRAREAARHVLPAWPPKEVIDYIKSLGVTTVELLPMHTFINDSFLLERKLTNYWGYNSIGFFAPDPRYVADPSKTLQEFKEMVARFHDAGPRGDPRRGLQPHRRGQRARADAVASRASTTPPTTG